MASFDRGFKTWAEKTAVGLRQELGLEAHAALPARELAGYLETELWTPHDVKGLSRPFLDQLLAHDKFGWSAVTLSSGTRETIIYNPSHSAARISSDIMHELAHIIAGHEPSRLVISQEGGMVLRSYDQKQEDEAGWLSGCLLLPRTTLLHIRRAALPTSTACSSYEVSVDLLNYRLNVTGVNFQFRHSRSAR